MWAVVGSYKLGYVRAYHLNVRGHKNVVNSINFWIFFCFKTMERWAIANWL